VAWWRVLETIDGVEQHNAGLVLDFLDSQLSLCTPSHDPRPRGLGRSRHRPKTPKSPFHPGSVAALRVSPFARHQPSPRRRCLRSSRLPAPRIHHARPLGGTLAAVAVMGADIRPSCPLVSCARAPQLRPGVNTRHLAARRAAPTPIVSAGDMLTAGLVTIMFGATGTIFNIIQRGRNDWKVSFPDCCELTPASPLRHRPLGQHHDGARPPVDRVQARPARECAGGRKAGRADGRRTQSHHPSSRPTRCGLRREFKSHNNRHA
jgi:hypothetical protein